MYTQHSNKIPEITVYKTDGSCQILTERLLSAMAAQNDQDMQFQIKLVTPKDIHDGYLAQQHVVGLVMPGRNKGSDYRSELGDRGMQEIHKQVEKGLRVHATCAGASVLSTETIWSNPFLPHDSKTTLSRWGLFQGTAQGLITDLCVDPYLLTSSPEAADPQGDGRIPLEVVTVAYAKPSSEKSQFDTIYNGGCDFVPYNKSDITPLLYHKDTKHKSYAAMSFYLGDGRCEFLNIHPELHYIQFSGAFGKTEKAARLPHIFQANVKSLEDSYYDHLGLFRDFAQECLTNGKMSHPNQPLMTLAVQGLRPVMVHATSSALACAS